MVRLHGRRRPNGVSSHDAALDWPPAIDCPSLAILGEAGEYGTMERLDRIERRAPQVRLLNLAARGHVPHRNQPKGVIAAIRELVGAVTGGIRQAAPGT